jgi:O-methyltransferase
MNLIHRTHRRFANRHILKVVQPYTLIGLERILSLCSLADRIERDRIPGDVMECGVCNGGSAAILAHFAARSTLKRTVWLLDSFQGMPQSTTSDGDEAKTRVGKEVGGQARVREVLSLVRANMDQVRIVPGWFEDTFPTLPVREIALLNIDADWYKSVKLCLETFYDRVVPGGFVAFDDYGHWPGCRKAVDEFFQSRQIPVALNKVDYTARWMRKE